MGPTVFLGLNEAVKQTLVMKQECLRPLTSQSLLKMLILSGLNEAVAVTTPTPLDLKSSSVSEYHQINQNKLIHLVLIIKEFKMFISLLSLKL